MNPDHINIKDILLKANIISVENAAKAEEYARLHNAGFTQYFIEQKLLTDDVIGKAIADSYHVPYSDLNSASISSSQVLSIPEKTAKKYRTVVFSQAGKDVVI